MTTPTDLGAPLDVEQVELTPQQAAFLRGTVAADEISGFLGRAFATVAGAAASAGAQITGPPFARYSVEQGTFDIRAGFPVDRPLSPEGDVECDVLPAGPALRILHVGAYEEVAAAYEAGEKWLAAHHGVSRGAPWECYLDEPDVAQPRTVVYMPYSEGASS
jgi:effector-binding domain-containing protein